MNLLLEVFCHTETTELMTNVGLEVDWGTLETKSVLFRNVDLAMGVQIGGQEYTEIHVGGNSYIAKIKFVEFIKQVYARHNNV
jgi:hypothetical protein